MNYATIKQIGFIRSLAAKAGFSSDVAAITDYGFGIVSASSLSISQASELIDHLAGNPSRYSVAPSPIKAGAMNKGGRLGMRGIVTTSGAAIEIVKDAGKNLTCYFPATRATIVFPATSITLEG